MFVGVILLIFVSFSIYWWQRVRSRYQHLPSFNHVIPFIGNIWRFPAEKTKLIGFFDDILKEVDGKTGVFWIFNQGLIISSSVQHFESILKSNSLIVKSQDYDLFREWLHDGLLLSKGKKWKTRRHMLTPAFHFNVLDSFSKTMNMHAKQFLTHLRTNASGSLLEFSSLVKHFTLDLLCETTMGIKQNSLSADDSSKEKKYINAIDFITETISERFRKPWLISPFMFKLLSSKSHKFYKVLNYVNSFIKNVVENRIKILEETKPSNTNLFVDTLISAYKNNEIDVEGIIEEVNTFMFEGYDTVSSAISWTIYMIGRDKRVQDKVFEEISNCLLDDLSSEALKDLDYLDCVIKECLRLHPPVAMYSRNIESDTVLESGLKIPANTNVSFAIYHMHRDESVWKNALSFIPERFQEEKFKLRNPFSFLPFSAGPRNCIGQRYAMMELKVLLFHLIKTFRFESIHEEKDLGEHMDVIHRAEKGIWVNIYKR